MIGIMIKPSHVLMGVFLLAGAAGGCKSSASAPSDAGTEGGAVITQQLCADMCQVTLQIDCPNQPTMADCVSTCLGEATVCTAPGMAYYECLVASGPQALECDMVKQFLI